MKLILQKTVRKIKGSFGFGKGQWTSVEFGPLRHDWRSLGKHCFLFPHNQSNQRGEDESKEAKKSNSYETRLSHVGNTLEAVAVALRD